MNNFTKYNLVLPITLMALLLTGCKDTADTQQTVEFAVDKEFARGPLTVHVRIDNPEMSIADTFTLELSAAIEAGYDLEMPRVDQVLANFGIRDWHKPGDKLDDNGNVVTTASYRLEPFLSGDFQLPSFVFEFKRTPTESTEDPKIHKLETEPIDIKVVSLLGQERAELVIADIEGVIEMPARPLPWWISLIPVAMIVIIVPMVIVLRRKKVAQLIRIFKPAHELAYVRLKALVDDQLIESGQIKQFYLRVSNILRHYIEDRFELNAPEQTTEEFLYQLQSTANTDNAISDTDKTTLAEFLKHCDLVKFAKHQPQAEQIQRTFDLVKEFIEKTRSDQYQVDVTDIRTNPTQTEAQIA